MLLGSPCALSICYQIHGIEELELLIVMSNLPPRPLIMIEESKRFGADSQLFVVFTIHLDYA